MKIGAYVLCTLAVASAFVGAPLRAPLRPRSALWASPAGACEDKIRAAISPLDFLEVLSSEEDPNGSHIMVTATSEAFEGLSSMKRQQLVYKAIWCVRRARAPRDARVSSPRVVIRPGRRSRAAPCTPSTRWF